MGLRVGYPFLCRQDTERATCKEGRAPNRHGDGRRQERSVPPQVRSQGDDRQKCSRSHLLNGVGRAVKAPHPPYPLEKEHMRKMM